MLQIEIGTTGYNFIYDGVPSEIYGLSLAFINSDPNNSPSGSNLTLETDHVAGSADLLYLHERQDVPLQFDIEIVCERPMDVLKQTQMKSWLFGGTGYKKLQICIENQNTFYYNCRLMAGEDINYGGFIGFRCTVQCDSPGAWEFPNTIVYDFTKSRVNDFLFNNRSGDSDYMKPIVFFTLAKGETEFSLVNKTDNNREFAFKGLLPGETVMVDNKNCLIESDAGLIRLDNFNKRFFRLLFNINELRATGLCTLGFTYQNFRRLGGGIV